MADCEKIEERVRREIAGFEPGDVLAGAKLTRELLDNSDLMDRVRWDARCVKAKGYDSNYREEKFPAQKRGRIYAKALDMIRADARFVPADGSHDFYEVAARLASGALVSGEEAEFAADVFARYEVFYLGLNQRCVMKIEDLAKCL